jgi:hypothetical protein
MLKAKDSKAVENNKASNEAPTTPDKKPLAAPTILKKSTRTREDF